MAAVARVVRLRPRTPARAACCSACLSAYFVTLGGASGVAAWAWGEEVLA